MLSFASPHRSVMAARPAASPSSTVAAAVSLLLLAAAAADVRLAGATEYTVGDDDGWTIGPSYQAWSMKYNFTTGDTLVFNYVPRQHDVFRVTQDAFRTCDAARNQTILGWASGHDVVELTAPGNYYFICNVSGHCLGGMKFSIAVGEPLPPPPSPPPPPARPPPPPPVGSGAAAASTRRRWPAADLVAYSLALIGLWIGW